MPQPSADAHTVPSEGSGRAEAGLRRGGDGDKDVGVDVGGGLDFDGYVAERRRALLRFATVLCGQPWLADDIVSDVLGRAFERWTHIGAVGDPHAYVRRMIVNDYLSWRRRLARTSPHADVEPALRLVDDSSERYAERNAMLTRLQRLPRRQRAAVVLRYYDGLPDADIATVLGCGVSTVRSQISRALATLRLDLDTSGA